MPAVPEELDVFHVPHDHMKKVVHQIEDQLYSTNFHNVEEYDCLMQSLSKGMKDLQQHEEIEDCYILTPLLPLLSDTIKAGLEHDIHSNDQLQCIIYMVDSAPLHVNDESDRIQYGENLKRTIINFTNEVIPHMKEEEEVFQPLLIKHYTKQELKALRETVLQLHKQRISSDILNQPSVTRDHTPSLVTLPQEILLKIFSYLSPQDLCRLSRTHSAFTDLAFDGSLWRSLHPVRWADDHWDFYSTPDSNKEEVSHDSIVANDAAKYLLSCGNSVNASLCRHFDDFEEMGDVYNSDEAQPRLLKETSIMNGLMDYVLPKVGHHVKTLDLAYGKSLTGEMIYRILSMCPNVQYLDLSHTMTTDYSFRGLIDSGDAQCVLKHLDLTGCIQITDTALLRIAWATTPPQATPTYKNACQQCTCEIYDRGGGTVPNEQECKLKSLILSGCHQITDVGLRSLAIGRGLPNLQYLNLSSVPRISSDGLNRLVSACPRLKPHLLFYCDNINNGPHPIDSNGCCNVEDSYQCCRNTFQS